MRFELSLVRFFSDVKGPGPLNQATTTKDYSRERKEHRDANLQIHYDTDMAMVLLVYPGARVRPLVMVPRERVERMEPVDMLAALQQSGPSPRKARGAPAVA